MGLPTVDNNLKAYEDSQLLKKYEGLRDKQYFLIHGTHDDNVHYQQSMLWSKVLELNDILFRQQVSGYLHKPRLSEVGPTSYITVKLTIRNKTKTLNFFHIML